MPTSPRAFYQVLRLHQLVAACLDTSLAPESLTAAQYTMLSLVRRLGPTTSAQLARWLQVSAQSTGETMKSLEARGWVERGASETNKRIVLLSLTPAGKRVVQRADQLVTAAEERFFAALSPREREAFDRTIQRLRQSVEPHDRTA